MDEAIPVTSLIPRSNRAYWIAAAAGLAIIALLVLAYASWAQWDVLGRLGFTPSDGRVEALDLDGEGSLAVWYSSALLLLAGQVALLIGWMRSKRPDDYAGRYRIWFWAAACWIGMSLDETASLHEAFKEALSAATGTRLFGDGSIWWAIPYFGVLALVGLKLFWEMRRCWLSSTLLQATGWMWALAVATQMGLLLPETGARGVMVEESAEMCGNLLLLLSMMLHARYVILQRESGAVAAAENRVESSAGVHRIDRPSQPAPPPAGRAKRPRFHKQ